MSWNINIVGSRKAVRAKIENEALPPGVKAAILEVCDDPKPYDHHNGLHVKGYGHNNDGKSAESNIGSLTVEGVELTPEPK